MDIKDQKIEISAEAMKSILESDENLVFCECDCAFYFGLCKNLIKELRCIKRKLNEIASDMPRHNFIIVENSCSKKRRHC